MWRWIAHTAWSHWSPECNGHKLFKLDPYDFGTRYFVAFSWSSRAQEVQWVVFYFSALVLRWNHNIVFPSEVAGWEGDWALGANSGLAGLWPSAASNQRTRGGLLVEEDQRERRGPKKILCKTNRSQDTAREEAGIRWTLVHRHQQHPVCQTLNLSCLIL